MATRQEVEGIEYSPKEWETVPCPFCKKTESTVFEKFGSKNQFTYVKCTNCKLVYQNPRPKYDDAFVHDAYEYYAENFIAEIKDPLEFIKKESEREQFEDFVKEIIQYDNKREAILDVGSFTGTFLYQAIKYYPIAYGVDVSSRMQQFIEKAIGVKIIRDKFELIDSDIKYSCINMSHVIEHIPNPAEWIQQTKNLLSPNGILVVSVPNSAALTQRFKLFLKRVGLRKDKWAAHRTPDHLFEPNLASMLNLFNKNGMEVVSYKSYSRSNMVDNSLFAKFFHKKKCWGSNLRFYVKVKQ